MLGVIAGIDDAVGAGGNGGIDDETDAILGHADENETMLAAELFQARRRWNCRCGRIDGEIGRRATRL